MDKISCSHTAGFKCPLINNTKMVNFKDNCSNCLASGVRNDIRKASIPKPYLYKHTHVYVNVHYILHHIHYILMLGFLVSFSSLGSRDYIM